MPHDETMLNGKDTYCTESKSVGWFSRTFPTATFYRQFAWNVYRSSIQAKRGNYNSDQWSRSSHRVLQSLESVGVRLECDGLQHVRALQSPCVFVANHMSMFETTVLPAIIQPIRDVTFVVKQSLLEYPVFKHVVGARNPIAVSRDNPRDDLKAVMKGGAERLGAGISIVVFPQTTRSLSFDRSQFNTIGIKLALRSGVPVVPIALVTSAWGNGRWIKDLGPIDPTKTVRIAFGKPLTPEGRGTEQHQAVLDFIEAQLHKWNVV